MIDRAPDRGAITGRRLRTKDQPCRGKRTPEFIAHYSGLDPGPLLRRVHFHYPVHVLGEVEDDSPSDSLSCETRAPTPRENRHLRATGDFQHGLNVVGVPGENYPDRLDLVDAGIGTV